MIIKSADKLAKQMTHDLDTAKELQNHAAKTQDAWIGAVENMEVTEIECAVCRALNQLRAATAKGFYIKEIIRLERIDHEQIAKMRQAAPRAKTQSKSSTHR